MYCLALFQCRSDQHYVHSNNRLGLYFVISHTMKMVLVWMLSTVYVVSFAQKKYTQGDVVKNFSAGQMLNYKTKTTTLSLLQSDVTILDFFGTWCAPCVKALPELQAYKNKFKEDVSILLVSTEAENKLTKFISSRQLFTQPPPSLRWLSPLRTSWTSGLCKATIPRARIT